MSVKEFLYANPINQNFEPTKSFDNEEFIDRFKCVTTFQKWDTEKFAVSSPIDWNRGILRCGKVPLVTFNQVHAGHRLID
mmetsp:Transcript_26777/g.37983  ORF Transcript_26777/g.37983 Transcript_26777/m.37983 type:complete len:80 (-) Transcript_26777:1629-1868(-)